LFPFFFPLFLPFYPREHGEDDVKIIRLRRASLNTALSRLRSPQRSTAAKG